MKNILKFTSSKLLIIAIALIASGCSQRMIDFTIISSKNINLARGAEFKRAKVRTSGEDKQHIIFFIPTGVPNLKEAMDRAIESTPGAVALVDGVVMQHSWWIGIYGQNWIEIKGTALIDPKLLNK